MRFALVLAVSSIVALLIAGCDDLTPRPPQVDTPTVVGSVPSPTDCTGAKSISRADLPTPGPVPTYSGVSQRVQTKSLNNAFSDETGNPFFDNQPGAQGTKETTFQTTDKPETVLDYYKDALSKDNWRIDNESSTLEKEITLWWAGMEVMRESLPCPPTAEPGEPILLVWVRASEIPDATTNLGGMTEVDVREGLFLGR